MVSYVDEMRGSTHFFSLNSAWAAASVMVSRFARRLSCVGSMVIGVDPDQGLVDGISKGGPGVLLTRRVVVMRGMCGEREYPGREQIGCETDRCLW